MNLLEKYGLHDTVIQNLIVNDDGLTLIFNKGIYQLKDGKECNITKSCQLLFKIMYYNPVNLYEHIEIITYKKGRYYEINFIKFVESLKKNDFIIDDTLYSSFSNTLLIRGYVGKNKIDFNISEISDVEVQFSET